MEPKNSDIDKESLLTEYKIAYENRNYYGKILWQIASIFLPISLAGFGFGIQQDLPLERFIPLNVVLTVLLFFFFFQAKRVRWLAHIQVKRCEEIEKILPMKLSTYEKLCNKEETIIAGEKIKPQRVKGLHLNQGTPLILIGIFWAYIILKYLGLIG